MRRRSEELEGFAGRVAHDLLNPIAAAEMSLAAAARSEGARREATLARANRSLGRARHLVDDLLAFAQAGARPPAGVAASVPEVMVGVLDEMRAPALRQGITLEVELPRRPIAVRCGAGVLASLVANLVGNAIKHMSDRPRRLVRIAIERGRRARSLRGERHRTRAAARARAARLRSVRPRRRHAGARPRARARDRTPAGRGARRPVRRPLGARRRVFVLVRAARRAPARDARERRPPPAGPAATTPRHRPATPGPDATTLGFAPQSRRKNG